MTYGFEAITDRWADVAGWISDDEWPFHFRPRPGFDDVLAQAERGFFDGPDVRSFWVVGAEDVRVGLVRVFDLGDPTPLFDLRVAAAHRGRGVGTAALRWATGHVFETCPDAHRFGGYTRADNHAMRRVFEKAGFTLEARHREAWRVESAEPVDSVGYAILRREWRQDL